MARLKKSFIFLFFSLVFSIGTTQVIDVTDTISNSDSTVIVPGLGGKITGNPDQIFVIKDKPITSADSSVQDTSKKKWKFKIPLIIYEGHKNGYDPKVAWQRSALIPGTGQIYNRRIIKPLIVWGGFVGLAFFIRFEAKEYGLRRAFHKCSISENCTPSQALLDAGYVPGIPSDNYRADRDYYRRNLELSIMITALWHTLNIIDAYVDAHLRDFNVSDDLSFKIKPHLQSVGSSMVPAAGVGFTFTFKQSNK